MLQTLIVANFLFWRFLEIYLKDEIHMTKTNSVKVVRY